MSSEVRIIEQRRALDHERAPGDAQLPTVNGSDVTTPSLPSVA